MEIIDVVDDNNKVIGAVPLSEIYSQHLPHRIVHILVFNDNNEMLLQLRSKSKSFLPSYWSTSVGGRVQKDETYEQAALREMQEEMRVQLNTEFFKDNIYIDKNQSGLKMFQKIYTAKSNGPFISNDKDVEKFELFSSDEIQKMVQSGEKFHSELLDILEKFYGIKPKN